MLAGQLTRALERAGIPILGVRITEGGDRSTWEIWYTPAATEQHRRDGEALKLTYDPTTDTAWVAEQTERAMDAQKGLRALARATWEYKANTWTFLEFVARIKDIYRTL